MTDPELRNMVLRDLANRNTEQREHASWPVIVSGGVVVWLLAMAVLGVAI